MSDDLTTTKDRLLNAAEVLFADKDFDEVSVRELAAVADVNVAAVNYHFQGKENLFNEVVSRRFVLQRDKTQAALDRALAKAEGQPALEDVIGALVNVHLQGIIGDSASGYFLGLLAREMGNTGTSDQQVSILFKEMVAPIFQAFSQALMVARPTLEQEDLNWIIASIVGQIHHFVFRWKKKQSLADDCETAQTMVRLFPALGLTVDQYIQQVTAHVTQFSCAAVDTLHPEVS